MATPQPPAPPRRPPPQFRSLEVKRVQRLTPRFLRITLGGPELAGFATRGPAEHVRLFFPDRRGQRLQPPQIGPQGPVWPPQQGRPQSRVYTPRRWDAAAQELDVEIMLHGEGPGSAWAAAAQPGDTVLLTGPGGAYRVEPADWYLLAADDAGLPALGTILDALPAEAKAIVFAEVADAAEERPLQSAAQVHLTWLHRNETGEPPGRALERALRGASLPAGEGRVWVACEATAMREIRRHLLLERSLPREAVYTHGYWKLGVANHPDHDLGQEI